MSFRCSQPGMNWQPKSLEGNEVHINSIWREHVLKEGVGKMPKTKFTINPNPSIPMNNGLGCRVPFVTDKVGKPLSVDEAAIQGDQDVMEVINMLHNQQATPTEKYTEALTSAQEVGWYTRPLVKPNQRFNRSRAQCPMVSFADGYTLREHEFFFHGASGKFLKF